MKALNGDPAPIQALFTGRPPKDLVCVWYAGADFWISQSE